MASVIEDFERDCVAAGVTPSDALREAGLNPSTWFRWKSGSVSPTLRSFEAARQALARLIDRSCKVVAPVDRQTLAGDPPEGAEKNQQNISRTGVAA